MGNSFYNLNFFPKEICLTNCEILFIDYLHSNNLLRFLVLTLVDGRKLTTSNLSSSTILVIKTEIARLDLEFSDPIQNDILVPMIELPNPIVLRIMTDLETVHIILLVLGCHTDIHSLKKYKIQWHPAVLVLIDEKSVVTQYIVSRLHQASLLPELIQFPLEYYS